MTKRLLYPNVWAEGGAAIDPDLDTTAPSFVANRYADLGWISEKPPEYWQNFLSQITDLKIQSLIISGIPEKDSSVTYGENALYKDSGKVYVILGGVPKEVMSINGAEYTSFVSGLNTLYNNHMSATNPHNDTVNTLVDKSYIKTDVDSFFGSASDPRTIVYHKNLTGASVHGETPAQVGTLSASAGGDFTGAVVLQKDAILSASPSKVLHLNSSTAVFELASGDVSIGIDSVGNCYVINSAGTWLIMDESDYTAFQIRWNNRFALPAPILDMHFEFSESDAYSVGNWTISGASNFTFSVNSGIRVDNNTISFTGFNVGIPTTVVIVGRDTNGTVVSAVKDWSTAIFNTMGSLLTNAGLSSAIYIERITCYPGYLTSYQKSMLVK